MKISGPDSTQKAGGVKKAGKAGSTSGASFGSLIETGESEAPAHAAATGVIAGIDSLLAAQESRQQRAAKKRMRERGETVLKQLDKIRLGMLTGTLSV